MLLSIFPFILAFASVSLAQDARGNESTVPGVSGTYVITELQTDMFCVTAGNSSIQTRRPVLQSFKLFEVDITVYRTLPNGSVAIRPKLRQVATFADAIVLNGLFHVDDQHGFVLVADSYVGVIWKVDIAAGSVTIAINDTSIAPTATKAAEINGLRYQKGYLYYTKTATNSCYRILVYPNAIASGNPSSLRGSRKETISYWTDLEQSTYETIASTQNNNSSSLLGPAAVAWGRTASSQNKLFITTNGGQSEASAQIPGAQGLSEIDFGTAAVPTNTPCCSRLFVTL